MSTTCAFAPNMEARALAPFPTLDRFDATIIEMIEAGGEWFVRIVEKGKESVQTFDLESFASDFAERQRIRLGVAAIVRL